MDGATVNRMAGVGRLPRTTLPPARFYARGNPPTQIQTLGIPLLPVAAAALTAATGGSRSPGGASAPVSSRGFPGASSGGPINVSPTTQTTVSPQISPSFFQAQGSPGATQAVTAVQEGGRQTALPSRAGSSPSLPSFPSVPSAPFAPGDLYSEPTYRYRDAGEVVRDIRESRPFDWTPAYILAGVTVGGIVLLLAMRERRKGR